MTESSAMTYNISFTNLTAFEADTLGIMMSDYHVKTLLARLKLEALSDTEPLRIQYLDQQINMCDVIRAKMVCTNED